MRLTVAYDSTVPGLRQARQDGLMYRDPLRVPTGLFVLKAKCLAPILEFPPG